MALVIATVLLSLLGIATDRSEETPVPTPPVAPQSTEEAAGFFGVAPQGILHKLDYRRMGNGSVSIIRIPLSWNQVQENPGDCEPEPQVDVCSWSEFDAIVGQAAAKGIRVFPTLGGRPAFTINGEPADRIREHPPISGKGLAEWQDFVTSAVARYGHGGTFWSELRQYTGVKPLPIEEWQIWNEANAASYWPPEPDASEYATLVSATADAIRASDPEAEIVLGGMFGTATVSAPKYLRELYAVEGVSEDFDSLAIHPYAPDVDGVEKQAKWVRRVAVAAGDNDVGMWATELGWGSGNGGHPLELGDQKQARRLDHAFKLFLEHRESWNVEGVTWFTWEDSADQTVCRFCRHAGLFDADAAPKRSWEVFKSYTEPDS